MSFISMPVSCIKYCKDPFKYVQNVAIVFLVFYLRTVSTKNFGQMRADSGNQLMYFANQKKKTKRNPCLINLF